MALRLSRQRQGPLSIRVDNVVKRFGNFAALNGVEPRGEAGRVPGAARPVGIGQDDPAADHGRARIPRCRRGPVRRPGRHRPRGQGPPGRLRLPALRPVPAHERRRQRRLRTDRASAAASGRGGPRSGAGRRSCSTSSSSAISASAIRPSSRAASASASLWRGRWPSIPSCSSSTSRSARSTPRSARSCAAGCRDLHDRMGLTSVFVTHDQEEALELADRVVVMDRRPDRAGRRARRRSTTSRPPPSSTISSAIRTGSR